jgi:signal transduction histidine kinase
MKRFYFFFFPLLTLFTEINAQKFKSLIIKILTRTIIIISFTGFFYNVSAQNRYVDSCRRVLPATNDDTSKVLLLSQMAYHLRYTNMDSSLHYAGKALSLARQLKFPRWEAYALSDLGLVLWDKGELPKSLEYEIKAFNIAEEYDDTLVKANSLRRMALVYYNISNYTKAINNCKTALYYDQLIGNNRGIAYDYQSTAMSYIDWKVPDSAWYFIQKAGENISSIIDFEADYLLWRGSAYLLKGEKDSALLDWSKGLRLGMQTNQYRTISYIYNYMGTLFLKINADSSIFYAMKGLEYAKMASNEKAVLVSSELLFELYDSLSRPKEALIYSKIAAAAKDSLFGAGNFKTIQELIANENSRQTEIQVEKVAYQNRLKQIMLITGMGAILIIAIILYRNNRKKQKTNLILTKQKAEIQEALTKLKSTQSQLVQAEKMASLGELTAGIAHEIQNPLNFVNNFSEVNTELLAEMREQIEKGNLEEVKRISGDMEANEHKILHHGNRADAIVKNMIQHARGTVGQKEPTNINSLAKEYLHLSYHAVRAKDKSFHVEIKTSFDETIGKIEIIPQDIGRVLVNLYNNAFYAVGEKMNQSLNGYEANITVATRKVNGMVEISVKDNGIGIPEKLRQKIFQPFFTSKPAGQGTGLGLSLSYDIIKAHGGDIKVITKENEGSEFLIQLPLNKDS